MPGLSGCQVVLALLWCIIGEEKAIEYIAKAGFDAWDFSMFKMGKLSGDNLIDHPLNTENYQYNTFYDLCLIKLLN